MSNQAQAKVVSPFLRGSVIYQLFLRPFTLEGTLKAATKLLPHIASLKVDIIYLCPTMVSDDDPNTQFWSDRQNASKLGNPKNPYRIKDYYNTDPEYGTNNDLRQFVDTAHRLGMLVILDLVYFHCGPTAVFIESNPDFVKRNPDGSVKNGPWHFPELNFASSELREYLWKNMEYWVQQFDVDGYRTDVEGSVPADFWEEGRKRIEKIKPDVIMLAESENPKAVLKAHDISYGFTWSTAIKNVFLDGKPASHLVEKWTAMRDKMPVGTLFLRNLENHDISMDLGENRWNRIAEPDLVEAATLLNFTIDGIPFIYNGEEIADNSKHYIFANRDFGGKHVINWALACTEKGSARLNFFKNLIAMRHEIDALQFGGTRWLASDKPNELLAFTRETEDQTVLVAINTTNSVLEATIQGSHSIADIAKVITKYGVKWTPAQDGSLKLQMLPYAYLVFNQEI